MPKKSSPRKFTQVQARRVGNWNKAIKFFSDLGFEIGDSVKRAQKEEVTELKKAIIRAIVTQKYAGTSKWPALKPATRYRKKENKNMIYMDTEKYVNSIMVKVEGSVARVGFRQGVTYKRRGGKSVSLEQVARWMEYGTRRQPARPLWGPTIQEMGGARGIRDRVTDKLYRKLKKLAAGTGIKINREDIRTRY